VRCGAGDLQSLEDPADGGCADPVAGLKQLALDPWYPQPLSVASPLDQSGDLGADRRSSHPFRVGPPAGDQAAVPSEVRCWV